MIFKNPMLVVQDLEKSKEFYYRVLGLRTILDFGANVTLTGGVVMQTKASWEEMIQKEDADLAFGGNNFELYFEEEDLDRFLQLLEGFDDIQYVHPPLEHRWGQRVVRFYDPDRHIIEVGEALKTVCNRFLAGGMTAPQVARRMEIPVELVTECTR